MGRNIDAALKTASLQSAIAPIILVKLEYGSGDVRVHSGIGTITFDGETYLGIGQFGRISSTAETSDGSANYLDLQLSGIDPALVSIQLNEYYQGRRATVWLGFLNLTTNALITPTIIFRGLMDNSTIELGKTATITLRVNNRFASWDKAKIRRYTDTDQQSRYAGDTGFKFVQDIAETQLIWGK